MTRRLLILFLLSGLNIFAQTTHVPLKRSIPVIAGYTQQTEDPFSCTLNQASLAFIRQPAFGAYNERRFLLKELSLVAFALALPHRTAGYGVNIIHAGSRLYNETTIALSFGRKLTEQLALGVGFGYFLNRIAGGVSASALTWELGSVCRLSEVLQAGFHIRNAINASLTPDAEKLATGYSFTLSYDVSPQLLLYTSVEKEAQLPANVFLALQYAFLPSFYVRTGISSQLQKLFAAVGLKWQKKIIEFNGGYHEQLGFTPALTLVFPFGKSRGE
jgi:hypothetical protein